MMSFQVEFMLMSTYWMADFAPSIVLQASSHDLFVSFKQMASLDRSFPF